MAQAATRTAGHRMPQAERSARMRERLARAAFEVIRDNGYVNFRTAAVARAAGVSQGAQLHHFPTKNSLAEAAIEYAWTQADNASLARIDAHRPGEDIMEAILDDARAFFFSAYFRVALDILMAGGHEPELRVALIANTLSHRGRIESRWVAKLVGEGYSFGDAEDYLALTLSLVRGFAIRALVEPGVDRYERLCARWAEMLRANRTPPAPMSV